MNGGLLILADEPTGALDSKSGQEMMNILHELNGRGHTIILVTQRHAGGQQCPADHRNQGWEIVRDQVNGDNAVTPSAEIDADEVETHCNTSLRSDIPDGERPKPHPAPSQPHWKYACTATWGRFSEAFKMALIAMTSHRMRTLLTMLGIIIGITSVVSVVALGQGARQKVIKGHQLHGHQRDRRHAGEKTGG